MFRMVKHISRYYILPHTFMRMLVTICRPQLGENMQNKNNISKVMELHIHV